MAPVEIIMETTAAGSTKIFLSAGKSIYGLQWHFNSDRLIKHYNKLLLFAETIKRAN